MLTILTISYNFNYFVTCNYFIKTLKMWYFQISFNMDVCSVHNLSSKIWKIVRDIKKCSENDYLIDELLIWFEATNLASGVKANRGGTKSTQLLQKRQWSSTSMQTIVHMKNTRYLQEFCGLLSRVITGPHTVYSN